MSPNWQRENIFKKGDRFSRQSIIRKWKRSSLWSILTSNVVQIISLLIFVRIRPVNQTHLLCYAVSRCVSIAQISILNVRELSWRISLTISSHDQDSSKNFCKSFILSRIGFSRLLCIAGRIILKKHFLVDCKKDMWTSFHSCTLKIIVEECRMFRQDLLTICSNGSKIRTFIMRRC